MYTTCLQSEFSSVSLEQMPKQMQIHIDCICAIFLQSAFSNLQILHTILTLDNFCREFMLFKV